MKKKILLLMLTLTLSLFAFSITKASAYIIDIGFNMTENEYYDLRDGKVLNASNHVTNPLGLDNAMLESWIRSDKVVVPSNPDNMIWLGTQAHYIMFYNSNDEYLGYKRLFTSYRIETHDLDNDLTGDYVEYPTTFLGTSHYRSIELPPNTNKVAVMMNKLTKYSKYQTVNNTLEYDFSFTSRMDYRNFNLPMPSPVYTDVKTLFELTGIYGTQNHITIDSALALDESENLLQLHPSIPSSINGLSIMPNYYSNMITISGTATQNTQVTLSVPNLTTGYFIAENLYGYYTGGEGTGLRMSNGQDSFILEEFFTWNGYSTGSRITTKSNESTYDRIILDVNEGDSFDEYVIHLELNATSYYGLDITPNYSTSSITISGTALRDLYIPLTTPTLKDGKYVLSVTNGYYTGVEGSELRLSDGSYTKQVIDLYDFELYGSNNRVTESTTEDNYDRVIMMVNRGDSFDEYVLKIELFEKSGEIFKDILSQSDLDNFNSDSDNLQYNKDNAFNSLLLENANGVHPDIQDIQGVALYQFVAPIKYYPDDTYRLRFYDVNNIVNNYNMTTGYTINTQDYIGDTSYYAYRVLDKVFILKKSFKTEFRKLLYLYQTSFRIDSVENVENMEVLLPEFFSTSSGINSENFVEHYLLYSLLKTMPIISYGEFINNSINYDDGIYDEPVTDSSTLLPTVLPITIPDLDTALIEIFDGFDNPELMKMLLIITIVIGMTITLFIYKAPWLIILFTNLSVMILFTILGWIPTWIMIVTGLILFLIIILMGKD